MAFPFLLGLDFFGSQYPLDLLQRLKISRALSGSKFLGNTIKKKADDKNGNYLLIYVFFV